MQFVDPDPSGTELREPSLHDFQADSSGQRRTLPNLAADSSIKMPQPLRTMATTLPVARLIAALAVCAIAVLGTSHMPAAAEDASSETFVSSPTDGHLRLNGDDGWEQLRSSNEAAEVFDTLRYVKINTRPDIIYRGFLFFDTSSLPDDQPVSAAILHIYSKCTGDLDDTHLYILGGNEDYPHEPLLPTDFALPDETLPLCAHLDVGEWADGLAYRTIPLDNAETVVNTAGSTKLCLLERRDYEDATPPDLRSENELKLFTFEEGDGYQPYLEVFWGDAPQETGSDGSSSPTRTVVQVAVMGAVVAAAAAISAVIVSRRRRARNRN